MIKTIFLDRDGVVNVDKGYVYKIEDFEFMPFVIDDLRLLQSRGFQIIIITNQSGIARGYYRVKDYKKLTRYYLKELKKQGVKGIKVLFCPHLKEGKVKKFAKECDCRKPNVGLFEKAIKKYKVDTNNSFAVGDKERDLEITKKYSGIKGFIINGETDKFPKISRLSELVEREV